MTAAHVDAWCMVRYDAQDGTTFHVWNARRGPAPPSIVPGGKTSLRVDTVDYRPDYDPPIGSAVFVDATLERAVADITERLRPAWPQLCARRFPYLTPGCSCRLEEEALRMLAVELALDEFENAHDLTGHPPPWLTAVDDAVLELITAQRTGRPLFLDHLEPQLLDAYEAVFGG